MPRRGESQHAKRGLSNGAQGNRFIVSTVARQKTDLTLLPSFRQTYYATNFLRCSMRTCPSMLLRTARAGICAGYFDFICLVQPAGRAADGVYILRSGEGVDSVLKGEAEVLLSTSSIQVTIYRQGQSRAMDACGGMPYRRRQRASNPCSRMVGAARPRETQISTQGATGKSCRGPNSCKRPKLVSYSFRADLRQTTWLRS